MSKSSVKTNRVSGFRIAVMIISILLLSLIMAFSMLLGISSLKHHGPVQISPDATTVRKQLPSDGTLPTSSTPLDNIGYMAYVLDHQPSYHVYAYNSTKSTGYEQVTQSWKDYKNAELSGAGLGVMVCSDLSYSALVKSSSQSCFIGNNEALMRGGNKPGKNSKPLDVEWSREKPSVYNKDTYKYAYGEFSTEISVYVINEQTLSGADDVVDNGDGTYSQKFYLNENAGCWYQYGMKTRGGLKKFPVYKKIEITFMFDAEWQVLESYCEEKATISPRALGGMDMPSDSKTTTTYDYTEQGFDNEHYAYYNDFFKQYQGSDPDSNTPSVSEPDVLDILGGGFSKVVGESGQQFKLAVALGETEYDGKVFLHLPDMGDILGTLDARLALEKRGSGKQDFYAEFRNGAVNVYYSTDFALTANIDEISQSVNKIADLIKGIGSGHETASAAAFALTAEESRAAFDITSLVNDLKKELTDTEAFIYLKSENLLGLGIGIDAAFGFDRTKEDDGDLFSVKSLDLNYVKYNGTPINLTAAIVPDDEAVITRQPSQTPANLADYAESVYKLLSSNTIKVDIGLDDKLIDGLTLNASAYLSIASEIAANVEISALYNGISLKLDASYIYENGTYGKVYLHVTEVNGKEVDAKIYCDIKDTVNTVKDIISVFGGSDGEGGEQNPSASGLAKIINKVLNLNLSEVIGKVSGNNEKISLEINVDALLKGLDVSLGINFGTVSLDMDRANSVIAGNVPSLGLNLAVAGSERELPVIGNTDGYVDINVYLESVYALLMKPSYDITVSFEGTKLTDKIDLSALKVNGTATVAVENKDIRVKLPVTVRYGEYGISLTAYYTVNLSDGSYGKVYLNVTSITAAEKETVLDAKVYCDIKDAVESIQQIITKFTPKKNDGTAVASEEASMLSKAIGTLLKLDYNQIISATNEKLTVNLNVDEILSGLEISLGGISFGELNLEFVTETATLSGSLEKLGLSLNVSGNDAGLEEFALSGYVDINKYLENVVALIGKNSYNLKLSFVGNNYIQDKIDLTGLKLDAAAQIAFTKDYAGVIVNIVNLSASYKDISLVLSAHYEVAFDGSCGTVYLDIAEVNGVEVKNAKVQLNITDAVNSVKNIINAFKAPSVQPYSESSVDIVANVINGILKLDFKELLSVTDEKATVKLDLDTLLSEFNLGLNLGIVDLEYTPADFTLTGSDTAIGLNLIKLSGSDDLPYAFTAEGYINLNDFIAGIEGIVNSRVYEIGLSYTGGVLTEKIDLSGLTLNATAYASVENGYNNITVYVPMTVSYCGLEVELSAYYSADINAENYSTVYIELKRIDGTAFNAKVYCDIQDVIGTVKEIIGSFQNGGSARSGDGAASADIISKVIGIVLNLDYPDIIKGSATKLSATVDVDEILKALEISLGGITVGDLTLELTLGNDKAAMLCGRLEEFGAEITLKGNNSFVMPAAPVKGDYLDLSAALKLVQDMIDEGKAIAGAKDAAFIIDADAVIDGVPVKIYGKGEVIWAENSVKVAVSLSVAVDTETLEINLVYDETAASGDPFVIITINEIGTKISKNEIDKLVNSFNGLINAFKKNDTSKDAPVIAPDASGYAIQVGGKTLEEILKNDNVKKVLNAVLGFINEFTVEIQTVSAEDAPEAIYNLIVRHADGVKITLGADGCLSIKAEKTDTFSLTASVEAGNGATVSEILKALANEKTEQNADGKYTYSELSVFVRKLFNGILDKIDSVSLKEVLGDNPYLVTLGLSGANSGISALEGVSVNAELYYDEGVEGTQRATKLMYVKLDLDINGTAVSATAAYSGRTLYIGLDKIGATALTGIKFRTDVSCVYDAAEQLVRLITDTNLVEMLNRITGKSNSVSAGDAESIAAFAETADENGNSAPSVLTKLIDALLTLNLEKSFVFDEKTNTATINIDSISEALFGVKIGTVTATLDAAGKKLSASVRLETEAVANEAWLVLNATPCAAREGLINPDDYMDIGFVSTLISDLVATITNDSKQIYGLYSFTGSIAVDVNDIPVLGSLKVRFNNATLSAGFDENNKFYLTLAASMQKTTAIGMTVTENRDISLTYCDGLIVLGRDIGTNKEIYKVLTLEYLLDNLLDKNNSPARWLLGTNTTVWGLLVDNLNVNIDSGLTKPKTYMLYEQLQQTVKEGKFNIADYLSGMTVKAGSGEPLSVYGGGATLATEKFSLNDDVNHYAFDLNGLTMKKLTGGVITAMCAVVTRNDGGLSGIKAYGEMGSMVNFTLDFGTYLEGVTEVYGGKVFNLVEASVTADTFYNDYAEANDVTENNFAAKTYYRYDGDSGEMVQATAFEEGVKYFEKVNTAHYVKDGDNVTLATEFVEGTQYYKYVEADSTKKLGTVAVRNYLAYVTEKYGFDKDHKFTGDKKHIDPIFGCFNSENNTYESSDVLETICLDVYADKDAANPERTLEVLYGSTVKLISDFPEFADEDKTQKLYYVNADDEDLGNEIVITDENVTIVYVDGKGRVSIYKSSETAVEVVFNFVGISAMKPVSAAFAYGDVLAAYELNDYSFLGWYKDAELTIPVANSKVNRGDVVGGKLTVYGKYIRTLVEAEHGVNYSFDTKLEGGRGGYFVSGVNENISAYYGNANVWLKIADNINGYPVKYIGREAFANEHNDTAHSLVNVLVPETVIAVYDRAFLDNKGLKRVAFCADKVFFGGRADADNKTSVFYGCYPDGAANNNGFTVYYNGTQNNPYSHISTTNNTVDTAWNRIYFYKDFWGTKTIYVMKTQSGGWSFAEFETVLPEGVDLSGIIADGIQFTAYGEAGLLANAINSGLPVKEGYYYEVEASGALPLDGKRHSIIITVTENEKIEVGETEITVTVKYGNDLLNSSTVNVDIDASLAEIYDGLTFADGFNKTDYVFLGWYTDEALTKAAPSTNNGNIANLYAKVVKQTVTAGNGVTYTFVAANDTQPAHYTVTSFDANNADKDYTKAESWLILENEISGIKVTEIQREAFGKKNIKNIVVPFNVTTIGQRAFLDNYGMLNAVFLANNVTMLGSVSGKDFPFYGCSTADGTNQTYLNVYFNGVTPKNQWNHFRDGNNFIAVGNAGGSINVAGTWGYVEFTVTKDYHMSDFGYADGLVKKPVNDDYLNTVKADVISNLNKLTAASDTESVIYKYSVTVTDKLVNGIHCISVTITENTANAWHKLALEGNDIQIEMTSDIESVNGAYFVKQGATVTVKPVSGNEGLTRLTAYGNTDKSTVLYDSGDKEVVASMTYTMQNKFAYLVAVRDNLPITAGTEITLRSAVEVSGFTDKDKDGIYEKMYVVSESMAMPEALSCSGYTFLGWAYENSSHILAYETTVNNRVYYAVWAYDRNEIVKDSVAINGDLFAADITGGTAASIYGWYAFETENSVPVFKTAVTPTTLTSATTIVYPRMVFTFSYTMTGKTSGTNNYFVRSDTNDGTGDKTASGSSYSNSFNILENTEVKYAWTPKDNGNPDPDKVFKLIYVDENGVEQVLCFRIKNGVYYVVTTKWSTCEVTITGDIKNTDFPTEPNATNSFVVDGNKSFSMAAK